MLTMRRAACMLMLLVTLPATGCRRAAEITADVVAVPTPSVPDDPADVAWTRAPEHIEKLLLQDLVEPRLMTPSTPEVRVRAIASPTEIAFRMEWPDPSHDDLPGNGRFVDACAVQLPQSLGPNAPDPQMGQPGKGVHITYWRADWQATVNGRGASIQDLYPNAAVDHYPFEAPSLDEGSDARTQMARRYAPADAVGNRRGGPRTSAVEELLAEGPGTIAAAGTATARGKGVRTAAGWVVVIVRARPADLAPNSRSQVAFAVWQGAADEAGARKMRSGWAALTVRGTT